MAIDRTTGWDSTRGDFRPIENPDFAEDFGDLSVHELAMSHVDDTLVYLSYYSGGFRVLRIVDDKLQEIGHFIDEHGNNLWGVQVFEFEGHEYVAASDRDSGLFIFEYKP